MENSHTPEQLAILEAAKNSSSSLMISAYAGCGKTSTLVSLTNTIPPVPALALAFNVKIKKELEKRFPSHFKVATLNGLGHAAWAAAIGQYPAIDERKLGKIVTSLSKKEGVSLEEDDWMNLLTLVTKAMQNGLVPSHFPMKGLVEDSPKIWAIIADENFIDIKPSLIPFAREILITSIKMAFPTKGNAPTISFDDQIYLSALLGGNYRRYPLVLVDEAQDLSPLNHLQLAKSISSRLIICGDPKQAIYSFRGADTSSMEKIRGLRQDWIDLPLTTTFRCPKKLVERQQRHAPGFTAFHTNSEGEVLSWVSRKDDIPWTWEEVKTFQHSPQGSIAILSRNNAPVLSMAFKLLAHSVGVCVLGRDIGKSLVALAKKILPEENLSAEICREKIESWIAQETSLARANDNEGKIAGIKDRGECLLVVLNVGGAATSGELRTKLKDLFSKEKEQVTLSTGHRSKGLEWDLVIHLDPWRVPAKQCRGEKALGQEYNLKYVIETRAKKTLILANLEDFL